LNKSYSALHCFIKTAAKRQRRLIMSTDWLPKARTVLLAKARNWIMVIKNQSPANPWNIPPEEFTEFQSIVNTADTILQKVQSSERTPVINVECKAAFAALASKMRFFKSHYFLLPPLTEADYVALELKLHDPASPIPVPEVQPEADLSFPGIHLVELRKIRPVSGGAAPDARSDYGVRIYYGLSGEPSELHPFRVTGTPKTGKDLPESLFTRRRKELFDFDGESGNTIYFFLRYENPSGKAGPFGPLLRAIIP
jgi:hypothetical protein